MKGEFREDLFYRIYVIHLELPKVQDRREDLPQLLHHHLSLVCKRFGMLPKILSEEAAACLSGYSWPGNIREMVNVMEMLVSLTDGPVIGLKDLPPYMAEKPPSPLSESPRLDAVKLLITDAERHAITAALNKTKGNKTAAAKMLGIQRSTLYEKIKKWEIEEVFD